MNTSTADSAGSRRADVAEPTQTPDPPTASRMWSSRLIGALFLAGFLLYGTGTILVTSVVDGPDFLADVGSKETTLALGAFLMIATAAADIGKAVIFYPVLERHGKRTAVAYLATMIFEMAMMTVGVLALLKIIPLAARLQPASSTAIPPRRSDRSQWTRTRRPTRLASSRSPSAPSSWLRCCSAPDWCSGGWPPWDWSGTRPPWRAPQRRSSACRSGWCC
jgi:hypothetical protein